MDLPPYILQLHEIFQSAGHELYAVGGCVRDGLIGVPVHEYDLTTDARPAEIRALVVEARPDSVYSMGEKFGTVGFVWEGTKVEVTTYRGEWYEPDSRKPRVQWGNSLEEDLARRDFTVNAMAAEIVGDKLIDLFDGRSDLDRKVIRAVGIPEDRFRDDPLRLLRAVRFASSLDFGIEPHTAEAVRNCSVQLAKISRERVRDELSLMLTGPAADRAISLTVELSLMAHIIPELLDLRAVETGGGRHKDIFKHTLKVLMGVPEESLPARWSALLHDIAKPRTIGFREGELHFNNHEKVGEGMARRILSGLKYDRPTIDTVAKVVAMHTHANSYDPEVWTDGAVRRFVRDAGDALPILLLLSRADITSYHTYKRDAAARRVDDLEERIARLEQEASIAALRPPLDGADLMRMYDRPPGPWIKPLKEYLLDLVIEGELAPDDRETAERLVREKYVDLYDE